VALVGFTQRVVVVSTVTVNSSVTVSMTKARFAKGVADTMTRKEQRAVMLAVFILCVCVRELNGGFLNAGI